MSASGLAINHMLDFSRQFGKLEVLAQIMQFVVGLPG